jgi:hypothetical protein
MQNKHNIFKICTLLQNLPNMQKYAHSNFRFDIMAPSNELLHLTIIKKKHANA